MSTPRILSQAEEGKAAFFLQFGGQGAPYLKEMQKLYAESGMQKYFDIAVSAIEAALEKVKGTTAHPQTVEFRKWLSDESSSPSDDQLAIAGISLGLIQATQFAHYEYLALQGFNRDQMLKHTRGASGHSQGLISASFTGLCLEGKAYEEGLFKYIQYLFLMGVRAQEVYTQTFALPEENTKSEALGAKSPAPMVAVLGESHSYIEGLVNEFNTEVGNEKIYVSLYNTPSNRILSSHRSSLIRFHEKFKPELDARSVKYVYLRASCPFHCEMMKPILGPFAKDIADIGFSYKGSDLKFPVYSFADGMNLQNEKELGLRMCDDLMVQTLYWEKSMKPVAGDGKITHIIDFGPGKTSQRLSSDTLAGMNCQTPVLAVAFPKDLKTLIES